jgi:hypothetical protein
MLQDDFSDEVQAWPNSQTCTYCLADRVAEIYHACSSIAGGFVPVGALLWCWSDKWYSKALTRSAQADSEWSTRPPSQTPILLRGSRAFKISWESLELVPGSSAGAALLDRLPLKFGVGRQRNGSSSGLTTFER